MEGNEPINPTNPQVPPQTTEPKHHTLTTNFGQKTIRTYESDIAEALESKQTSQVSINLAQVERQRTQAQAQAEQPAPEDAAPIKSFGKDFLKILLSIVLIGAGGYGGYYFYTLSPLAAQTPAQQQTASLVPAIIAPDAQKTINIQNKTATGILSLISAPALTKMDIGQITELIFYETPAATDGQATTAARVTAPDFISKIGLTPPDVLTRSLNDSWMFGLHQEDTPKPFIILTTNFFQNTFSGMLKWEPTMADDLSKFFGFNQQITTPQLVDTATTSTSTTVSTPPTSFYGIRGSFVDKIIQNKDIREFKDQNGNILFLYAFIDNNTLVIAQEEATLGEVITRFEKRAYIR